MLSRTSKTILNLPKSGNLLSNGAIRSFIPSITSRSSYSVSSGLMRRFASDYTVEDDPAEDKENSKIYFKTRDNIIFNKAGWGVIADSNTEEGNKIVKAFWWSFVIIGAISGLSFYKLSKVKDGVFWKIFWTVGALGASILFFTTSLKGMFIFKGVQLSQCGKIVRFNRLLGLVKPMELDIMQIDKPTIEVLGEINEHTIPFASKDGGAYFFIRKYRTDFPETLAAIFNNKYIVKEEYHVLGDEE